jgi:hypothetical protein
VEPGDSLWSPGIVCGARGFFLVLGGMFVEPPRGEGRHETDVSMPPSKHRPFVFEDCGVLSNYVGLGSGGAGRETLPAEAPLRAARPPPQRRGR